MAIEGLVMGTLAQLLFLGELLLIVRYACRYNPMGHPVADAPRLMGLTAVYVVIGLIGLIAVDRINKETYVMPSLVCAAGLEAGRFWISLTVEPWLLISGLVLLASAPWKRREVTNEGLFRLVLGVACISTMLLTSVAGCMQNIDHFDMWRTLFTSMTTLFYMLSGGLLGISAFRGRREQLVSRGVHALVLLYCIGFTAAAVIWIESLNNWKARYMDFVLAIVATLQLPIAAYMIRDKELVFVTLVPKQTQVGMDEEVPQVVASSE